VLVSPAGTNNLTGLRANDSRMGHVASGPMIPLDQVPVLLASADELPGHVKPDAAAGPMRFRLTDVAVPESAEGLPLLPFFRLHDTRYQMYWQLIAVNAAQFIVGGFTLSAQPTRATNLTSGTTLGSIGPRLDLAAPNGMRPTAR